MSNQPWKTDNWFSSAWNYNNEVVSEFNFAKNLKIHDVTLRDGEQQTGIAYNFDDKLRIAEALAEAGMHRIEAGLPAVSAADKKAIAEIVKKDFGPEIYSFCRCMKQDVDASVDCGVKGLIMEVPASTHLIEYGYKWPLQKAIDTSVEATAYAHEQGLEVVFFPIDFSRSELSWVLELINKVASDGHMDALALVDTFGVISPHAMKYFVRAVKEKFPDTRLEAHFHQDFSLGVANTLLSLAEGVEVVHSTVLGIGERSGNAPTEDIVMALLTMYGIDLGIKTEKLYPLAKLVEELSKIKVPTNKSIVGDMLYQVESGIIANWFKNCGNEHLTELFPMRPELVGQPSADVVMGKGSGIDSVNIWLDKIGIKATEEESLAILMEVKQKGTEKKALLSIDEFKNIANSIVSK
ncbi:MAG: pyruvate carboxyltransferase [Gammaproteobacteria bacterium TMED78]|nr:MAG: pyruvate carboxyltransferase [Gammaproteobacteria bacterium TMED78]|tara:strand:- start:16742 stop:17968 length:1227 start_codon:yes stop_codon:yes gene_type:complete